MVNSSNMSWKQEAGAGEHPRNPGTQVGEMGGSEGHPQLPRESDAALRSRVLNQIVLHQNATLKLRAQAVGTGQALRKQSPLKFLAQSPSLRAGSVAGEGMVAKQAPSKEGTLGDSHCPISCS